MYNHFADFLHKKLQIDARYFLNGGFWLFLTQGIVIFLGIITTALFAHVLSEQEYGIYKYLIGIAALLSAFSLTGLGESILQTAAKKYYNFYQETLRINFHYSIGIILAGAFGAGYYWVNDNLTLAVGCLFISLFQPIINSFQFVPAYLQGDGRYKESALVQSVKTFFVSSASLVALLLTNKLLILFAVYLASQALANTLSFVASKKQNHTSTPREVIDSYISYAKNTSLRNAVSLVAGRSDAVVIFTTLGSAPLAMYAIAIVIPEQIKGVMKNLVALLVPKYSQNTESLNSAYVKKRSLEVFIILLIGTIVYILVAPLIYKILFPKYTESILYSQIFALGLPSFIFYIPYSILKVRLKEAALYKITIISSITQVLLLLTMTFSLGLVGAIISAVVYRYFLATLVYFLYFKSEPKEKATALSPLE